MSTFPTSSDTDTAQKAHAMHRGLRIFLRDRRGASIVEFALLLPLLLLCFMHLVDFSRAFNERKRVVRLASTLSDIVAQQSTTKPVPADLVASVFDVAPAVMTPFPADDVKMTVSVIELTKRLDLSCCDAKVRWTATQGGTLRPCNVLLKQVANSVPPAPDNVVKGMIDNYALGTSLYGQLVVADVDDGYSPMFGVLNRFFVGGFQKTTYSFPRGAGDLVLRPAVTPTTQQRVCF